MGGDATAAGFLLKLGGSWGLSMRSLNIARLTYLTCEQYDPRHVFYLSCSRSHPISSCLLERRRPPQIHLSNPSAPLVRKNNHLLERRQAVFAYQRCRVLCTSMHNMSRDMGFVMLGMPRRTFALEKRPMAGACDWSVATSRSADAKARACVFQRSSSNALVSVA